MYTARKVNNDLFYVCSLIEYISRHRKSTRGDTVSRLGLEGIETLLQDATVLHCMSIEQAADEVSEFFSLGYDGSFDNVGECRFRVPTYWDIGIVYARLITDIQDGRPISEVVLEVYTSWMDRAICDFNSATYFSTRDFLEWAYREGENCLGG